MQFAAEKVIPVTLIPGDGIGPEIVEATVMVFNALGCPQESIPARATGASPSLRA
jgi:isocitrate/isopropylmalate dehydrogenase